MVSRAAGRKSSGGDDLAVFCGEFVPDQIGALRHGDQPHRFVERLRVDPAAADLCLPARGVQRVGGIARGVGQQDLARPLRVARLAGHLIDDAGALHFAGVAVVVAGDHARVEIAIRARRVAAEDLAIDGADVLPLPGRDLLAGGEARAVFRADVPMRPVAGARRQFDGLSQRRVCRRAEAAPARRPLRLFHALLQTCDSRGVEQ